MENGTLNSIRKAIKRKKIFIMDRNDGECYYALTNKEAKILLTVFSNRFIEQLQKKGQWVWIILTQIPGNLETDYEWEEYENYE